MTKRNTKILLACMIITTLNSYGMEKSSSSSSSEDENGWMTQTPVIDYQRKWLEEKKHNAILMKQNGQLEDVLKQTEQELALAQLAMHGASVLHRNLNASFPTYEELCQSIATVDQEVEHLKLRNLQILVAFHEQQIKHAQEINGMVRTTAASNQELIDKIATLTQENKELKKHAPSTNKNKRATR